MGALIALLLTLAVIAMVVHHHRTSTADAAPAEPAGRETFQLFGVDVVIWATDKTTEGAQPTDVRVVRADGTTIPCEVVPAGLIRGWHSFGGPEVARRWKPALTLHRGDAVHVGVLPADAVISFDYCPGAHA